MVNKASYTKLNQLDNADSETKDKLVEKAKKLNLGQMREMLLSYYHKDDTQERSKIKQSVKGKHDIPDTLTYRLVNRWKLDEIEGSTNK